MLNDKQRAILVALLEAYTAALPPEVAAEEMRQLREAGVDKIHFAFTGGSEPGQQHTYRVHGPTFVLQYLNVQADSARNPANHIHTCWRSLSNDFGLASK